MQNSILKRGGKLHVFIQCDSTGIAELKGEYLEIIKNKKLVFTWTWQNEPLSHAGNTVVTVEFIDLEGRTEVRLLHEGFSSEEFSSRNTEGWAGMKHSTGMKGFFKAKSGGSCVKSKSNNVV